MKLSDIMDEVEKALEIDQTNLANESLSTGRIYGKFLRYRSNENIRLSTLKNDLKSLYIKKSEYYSGKALPEIYRDKPFNLKLTKSEVDSYVEGDSEIQLLLTKIDIQTEKVTYLVDALKMISARQFQIKNAIDYQKLLNGAM